MTSTARTATMLTLITLAMTMSPASRACDTRAATPSTSRGPHEFSLAAIENALWREGDEGEPLFLRARVLDSCGRPVAGARVQILHANHHGDHEPDRWRGALRSDERGEFKVITVVPGYAGSIARHIHFIITHPDHPQLVTRLFFKNDPAVGRGIDDLAMVVEEVRSGNDKRWVASYEFVLPAR